MVDFVYPSIFGIGASVLFIVLLIACCVRWMRLYKMQHSNTVTAVCNGAIAPGSAATLRTTGHSHNYPPPYTIRVSQAGPAVPGRTAAASTSNFWDYYHPFPDRAQADMFVALSRVGGRITAAEMIRADQRPISVGVPSFNYAETALGNSLPAPPSYYDDRPPSYDDVVAAGKAITVPKVQKNQVSAADSSQGQNR